MTLCNTKEFLESSDSAYITARALVDEMAMIARALGLRIEDEYLDSLLSRKDLRCAHTCLRLYLLLTLRLNQNWRDYVEHEFATRASLRRRCADLAVMVVMDAKAQRPMEVDVSFEPSARLYFCS